MSLNCNEINAVLAELDLAGAFIQQIVQPGYDSLALYCYKNGRSKTVLICLAPGATRIHETRKKVPKNDKPLRFNEFLKSRIKGCRINRVEQLGFERIIRMDVSNSAESFIIFIRLWSAASNIIVTDENLAVLDVFYRRPKKNEVSGGTWTLPEVKDYTADDLAEIARKYPVRSFLPEADETAAGGDAPETSTSPLPSWHASMLGSESGDVSAPKSYSELMDNWYSEHAATLSRTALLEQAEKVFHARRTRMEAALKKLEEKRESFLTAEQWKHQGDLILTYGHLIDGTSNYLECTDYDTGSPIRIPIDPKKRVQENAALYYEKYKKALSGLDALEHDIQKAKRDLTDLEFAYDALVKEPNPIRMQQMLRKQTKPKQQIAKKHPGIGYVDKGWTILVGRDADENDELLRHHVRGADLWMHTRDVPGGFVFIKAQSGKSVPLDILLDAGNLAVYYSKARKNKAADLYYTQVKYLRRAKNGPKGKVLPTQEKNIAITLDEDRLRHLEDARET